MQFLFIIGASQALFLFILSLKSKKSTSNNMLSILLFAFAFHLLLYSLSHTSNQFVSFSLLRAAFPSLYGPSLFLYIKFQTRGEAKQRIGKYIHFIPFFFIFACVSVLIFLHERTSLNFNDSILYNWGRITIIISFAFYGIASFKCLKRHKLRILQRFSYTEKIDLKWIQLLLLSLVLVWGIIVVLVFINKLTQILDNDFEKNIIYCVLCIYVFFIGYKGIKQSAIVSIIKENETDSITDSKDEQINDNDQVYFNRIKQLVEEERLYLNPKLSIKEIAERLKTNVNYISRAINNCSETLFSKI
jgi:hypothetical protein